MKILSLKEKTTRYISNNFTILNRDYNTWRIPLEKKKTIFCFLLTFSLYISHNFLLFSIFFSFLFYLLSLTQLFKTAMSSISLTGICPLLLYTKWPNGLPFISSSFPSLLPFNTLHIKSQ